MGAVVWENEGEGRDSGARGIDSGVGMSLSVACKAGGRVFWSWSSQQMV